MPNLNIPSQIHENVPISFPPPSGILEEYIPLNITFTAITYQKYRKPVYFPSGLGHFLRISIAAIETNIVLAATKNTRLSNIAVTDYQQKYGKASEDS